MSQVQWGEVIEKAYQQYRNYGLVPNWSGWETYPATLYHQLEDDGFIAPDAWRAQMPEARSFLIAGLHRKIAINDMQYTTDIQTRTILKTELEFEIMKYRSGDWNDRVALKAKQWLVLDVFKAARKTMVEHLYVFEPAEHAHTNGGF